jgi:hypothetical protein
MLGRSVASGLLADLTERGFTLRVAAGQLAISPASSLTQEDREVIKASRADLLILLSPAEPWDAATAHRLAVDTDALVEGLNVDGRHPAIQEAAAMVVSALETRDLETVRFACSEFTVVIHELVAGNRRLDQEHKANG